MNQRANRTFVCSVLYLDLVGYSTQSVTAQLKLKQTLNGLLREVLRELAAVDRIVLEVAGGLVVSFLGRPADALFVALDLRQKMAAERGPDEAVAPVRIGINLGPVRVVDEPGGQINLLGDGISVAERIMNFADPDTVLVSRSYYEVLRRELPEFEPVFRFEGTRTDRQVREHSVFTVDLAGAALLRANMAPGWRARPAIPPRGAAAPTMTGADGRPAVAPDELRSGVLAAAVLIAMTIIVFAWTLRSVQRATPVAVDPLAAAPVAEETASPPAVETPAPPPARRTGGKRTPAAAPAVNEQATPVPDPAPTPAVAAPPPVSPAEAGGKAVVTLVGSPDVVVTLAIAPWGEVYLDGQYQGVSPPLKKLNVPTGWHDIEVRNTKFPVFQKRFEAKSGTPLRIEHRY